MKKVNFIVAELVLVFMFGSASIYGDTLFDISGTGFTTNPDSSNIGGGFHLTANNTPRLYEERTNTAGMLISGAGNPTGSNGNYEGFYRHLSSDGDTLGTVSLDNVGDSLAFDFVWWIRATQAGLYNSISLFSEDTVGTPGENPASNAGYRVIFELNGTTSAAVGIQKTAWDDTTNPDSGDVPTGWVQDARIAMQMSIERTGESEMIITLSDVTDSGSPIVLATLTDTSGIITSFNTLTFAARNTAYASYNQVGITSIAGVYSQVPEPMTMAFLGFGGWLMVFRKKSK